MEHTIKPYEPPLFTQMTYTYNGETYLLSDCRNVDMDEESTINYVNNLAKNPGEISKFINLNDSLFTPCKVIPSLARVAIRYATRFCLCEITDEGKAVLCCYEIAPYTDMFNPHIRAANEFTYAVTREMRFTSTTSILLTAEHAESEVVVAHARVENGSLKFVQLLCPTIETF